MSACASLAGAALVWCLSRQPGCLPVDVGPERLRWLAATAEVESGPRGPWAIRDETEKRGMWFRTREAAEREALARHARGHVLGLGPFQITHGRNWRAYGLADAQGRPVHAFNLCRNVRAAAEHMRADHERAVRLRTFAQFNGGPRAVSPGAVPAADAYALRVEARLQRLEAPETAAAPGAAAPCPGAPTDMDAWGAARHAARCGRAAGRRSAAPSAQGPLNQ